MARPLLGSPLGACNAADGPPRAGLAPAVGGGEARPAGDGQDALVLDQAGKAHDLEREVGQVLRAGGADPGVSVAEPPNIAGVPGDVVLAPHTEPTRADRLDVP